MAMTPGSVSVSAAGVVSGTGFAKTALDADIVAYEAEVGAPATVAVKKALPRAATREARILQYVIDNAQAKIFSSGSGTPSDGLQNGTTAPATNKFLSIV